MSVGRPAATSCPAAELPALARIALQQGDPVAAVRRHLALLLDRPERRAALIPPFLMARNRFRLARQGCRPDIVIAGWSMGHNPAGRVRTLADLHAHRGRVSMLGSLFPRHGATLWPPLQGDHVPCRTFLVTDDRLFPGQALAQVAALPADIVHVSKPRFPGILFGLLYKLVWDARVVMDIDDEELAFAGATTPLSLDVVLQRPEGLPCWGDLTAPDWTRLGVGLADIFDGLTVSNPALAARYGAPVLPHARPADRFRPDPARRAAARARFGVPTDATVALFFGTPRAHKGLEETARALAALNRPDLHFVIAGSLGDPALREAIAAVPGLAVTFLPDQPYAAIPDIVAMGDFTVLMQDPEALVSQFQAPAKLTDALAMGLAAFVRPTPAIADLIDRGAAVPVTETTLVPTLARYLDTPGLLAAQQAAGRAVFLDRLSVEAARPVIDTFAHSPRTAPPPMGPLLADPRQARLFEALGGWDRLSCRNMTRAALCPDGRRLIVYTVLTGAFETPKPPEATDPTARYLLFTDDPGLAVPGWEVVVFDPGALKPRQASRLPKLLPHRFLPDHDVSLYVDASLTLLQPDIRGLVDAALGSADLAAYPHFRRDCVYDEIDTCIRLGLVEADRARAWRDRLLAEGYPRGAGLLENAFLIRRDTAAIRRLNEDWHAAFTDGPGRDQLHLMPLLRKHGLAYAVIGDSRNFRNSPHVRFTSHNRGRSEAPLVNWVIGGRASRGWAYENNALRLSAHMPDKRHVIDGEGPADCAIYFDTLIHRKAPRPATASILRLGGFNPLRRVWGDDAAARRRGLARFDGVIALNHALAQIAAASVPLVAMIPNGLDLARFHPRRVRPDGPFVAGFAANCKTPEERAFKGLDLAEAAAAAAGVPLLTLRKGLTQIPHDRIVPDFYHRIDCLLHPVGPGKEGSSNVIMEALACGVPVITTTHAGYHASHLRDGEDVLLVERDPDALAEAVRRLRDSPELAARIGAAGRRFAEQSHDIARVAAEVSALIDRVIEARARPAARPLTIGLIGRSFWPKFAGMEMMIHNLAEALGDAGHRVTLFARHYNEPYEEIRHSYDLRRYRPTLDGFLKAFEAAHAQTPFDVLYVQGAYLPASYALALRARHRIPIILRTHGDDIQTDPELGYGLRLDPEKAQVIDANLNAVDTNVAIGPHILEETRRLAPAVPAVLIPNGVDTARFSGQDATDLHGRLGLAPTARILLTVGRNVPKKCFHLAIEALALVRRSVPEAVLVHVGKDGDGADLAAVAARLGQAGHVFRLGEVPYPEMPAVYAAADVFVFPARTETFGNVTIEAMASGLPCVEFDYVANRDKIVEGVTGHILPHGDVAGMARCIVALLCDAARRQAFGRAGQAHVRDRFAWPIIAGRYVAVFRDLLTGTPAGPPLSIALVADKMITIRAGGGEKSLTALANAMAARGHRVHLIIKEPGVARSDRPFYALDPAVRLDNIYGWTDAGGGEAATGRRREMLLGQALARIRPDVVLGFFLPEFGYVAGGVAASGLALPLILSHRNDPAAKRRDLAARYPGRLEATARAEATCQRLTVQLEPYLALLPPEQRAKALVIPNAVDPVPADALARPDAAVPRRVILNVARLVEAKNQQLLIRAFAGLADRYPDWDVHIYGSGPLWDETKALIASLGLAERVRLMGTVADIAAAYRSAQIFAFPSRYEGFSRALSEAMMHALPAVGLEGCICAREFLSQSGGGILTPDSVEAHAAALDRLMGDPALRVEMGRRGRAYMEAFSPDAVFDQWEHAFRETIAAMGDPARAQAGAASAPAPQAAATQTVTAEG